MTATITGPTIAMARPPSKMQPNVLFYKHQAEGIKWLIRRDSALLCDDMGLGKTIQIQTALAWMRDKEWVKRILVVATPSLIENWMEETRDKTSFDAQSIKGSLIKKTRSKKMTMFGESTKEILVINYEQVVGHLDELIALGFDAVVLDECHLAKNKTSARTKAVMALCATVKHRFLVTGSPILNHVDDLWTLLHMVNPTQWPSYWTFRNRYVKIHSRTLERYNPATGKIEKKKINEIVGVKNEAELHRKLSDVMLRREKTECIDLPEKLPVVYHVEMTPEQAKIYQEVLDTDALQVPDDPDPMEIENALTRFGVLKQICGTTKAVDEAFGDHSGKLDLAIPVTKELFDSGESVVVFTQSRAVLAAYIDRMCEAGLADRVFQIHGDIKAELRRGIVAEWAAQVAAGTPSVMCCMYQVGGVGLNMTACSTVMRLDKLFVPKLNEQAVDRVHRIGVDLTKPVKVIDFVTIGSIEHRIEEINRGKSKVFGMVVDGLSEAEYKRRLVAAIRAEAKK